MIDTVPEPLGGLVRGATVIVQFPGMPVSLSWPSNSNGNPDPAGPTRYNKLFSLDFRGMPYGHHRGLWSFIGVDRGGVVEAHIEIYDPATGEILFLRSEHKETIGNYNAWKYFSFNPSADMQQMMVNVVGYVTDPKNSTKINFELRFQEESK